MWRRVAALVALVVAAAGVAAGAYWLFDNDGSSAFDRGACLGDQTAMFSDAQTVNAPAPTLTLEEARQRYEWFRFPAELPSDASVHEIWARRMTCQPEMITVYARIDGPGYWFALEERNFGGQPLSDREATLAQRYGTPTTPVVVDSMPAELQSNGAVWMIRWTSHDRYLYLAYTPVDSELSPERLVNILRTME